MKQILALLLISLCMTFQTLYAKNSNINYDAGIQAKTGDQIVFLGNAFFDNAVPYGELEASLALRWPNKQLTFRNIGWSGDTVYGHSRTIGRRGKEFGSVEQGYLQLSKQLQSLKPDIIFIAYGYNESFAGDAGLERFDQGLRRLLDTISELTTQIVLLSPTPMENGFGSAKKYVTQQNLTIQKYFQAIQNIAAEQGHTYIDLFNPLLKTKRPYSVDGIHPSAKGYRQLAKIMAEALQLPQPIVKLDSRSADAIRSAIVAKNKLYFHYWRPSNDAYISGPRERDKQSFKNEQAKILPLIEKQETVIHEALMQLMTNTSLKLSAESNPLVNPPTLYPPLEGEDSVKPDLEKELVSFTVADGFEINLYAATPMIAKPIHINFDSEGRLWVAGSHTYPQLNINEEENDRIIILEDTDQDGVADASSVFDDRLLIPAGILPDGKGGGYVAHRNQLIHLHDDDGDGRADRREVVLNGFGTEDTHQALHRLSWGPDGKIYMLQGHYIASHAETLYGPRRLNGGGLWSYDTQTRRLEIYNRGLVNPWGVAFNRWGQTFQTDGGGTGGLTHSFPDSVLIDSFDVNGKVPNLLQNRPKHSGITNISGHHFPKPWRSNILTSDFRAQNIDRYSVDQDGSTYLAKVQEDLLSSSHKSFRPVDTIMGPDGALYVADWYNPIIQHGEVDFRDKRRDQIHGRIWRITAKERELIKKPNYEDASIDELLELLKSKAQWERLFAKQNLKLRDQEAVEEKLKAWVSNLDPSDSDYEHHRLEALWTLQTLGKSDAGLLADVAQSKSHNARAGALRILYSDHSKVPSALAILKQAVNDPHPLVRREAISSLGQMASVDAFMAALTAYNNRMEQHNEFALMRSSQLLEPYWMPAFRRGALNADKNALMFAISAIDTIDAAKSLITLFTANRQDAEPEILTTIGRKGNSEELNFLTETISKDNVNLHYPAAVGLLAAATERRTYPSKHITGALTQLLSAQDTETQVIGCKLAGLWRSAAMLERLKAKLIGTQVNNTVRRAAAKALVRFDNPDTRQFLTAATSAQHQLYIRVLAATALTEIDVNAGIPIVVRLLGDDIDENSITYMLQNIARKKGAFRTLSAQLAGQTIKQETANIASRIVKNSRSANSDELFKALLQAGSIEDRIKSQGNLSITELMANIEQGDPEQGKVIYQRPELSCDVCHKINGVGISDLGPDLGSIGTSAPLDYIIEALLIPSKKIKEGYDSSNLITKDGNFYTGSIQKEDGKIINLKTTDGEEITILKENIESRETSETSLMPDGLLDSLNEAEVLHLVKYLSQLGNNQ